MPEWGPPATSARRARGAQKPKRKRRIAGRIVLAVVMLVVLGMIASATFVGVSYATLRIPDPNAEFTTNTTNVYYDNGKTKLGDIEVQNRQSIRYDQMPDSIKNAVVAAENETFWTDPGYSIPGMIRAGFAILRGGELQGGSTITQQYIKIMYLTQDQTVERKIKEVLLARKLSQQMSKQEILTGYLNAIYFGRGAYGIQAASEAFFDKDASQLNVKQSAVLASVLNSPGYYDPQANGGDKEPLRGRYQYVLGQMAKAGFITEDERAQYAKKLPKLPKVEVSDKYGGPEGFLLKSVESELATLGLNEAKIRGGGYKITTTFNRKAQKGAQKAAKEHTEEAAEAAGEKKKDLHVAIASVDVNSGGVVAMYGGRDYVKSSRNWATTPRATASTFKPFALAAGLDNGFSLNSTMNGNTFTPPGEGVEIRNEFGYEYGEVSLLEATADSINTAFVDLVGQLPGDGPQKVSKMAQKLGATKEKGAQDWQTNTPRIAIGSAQVSPVNMASAYGTFSNYGTQVDNHVIDEIRDRNGKVIYQAEPETNQAVSKDVAADVTYALQGVVKDGTGAAAQELGRPVAGKTGTQGVDDDITSAWFTGYTRQLSTSVMYVAGDSGNKDLDDYRRPGDPTFFGSSYPLETWMDYMETASEGQKVMSFPEPAYVNSGEEPEEEPESVAPETSAPETEAPQTTEPEPSEPETSEPEPSDPETSEPEPTDSAEPEPEPSESEPPEPSQPPETSSEPEPTDPPTQTEPTDDETGGSGGESSAPTGPTGSAGDDAGNNQQNNQQNNRRGGNPGTATGLNGSGGNNGGRDGRAQNAGVGGRSTDSGGSGDG